MPIAVPLLHIKMNLIKPLKFLSKSIKLDPKLEAAYYVRGCTYLNKNNCFDKAMADLNQAIKLDPKDARVYYCRGCAYKEKADHDNSLKTSSRLNQLSIHPQQSADNSEDDTNKSLDMIRAENVFAKAKELGYKPDAEGKSEVGKSEGGGTKLK
jgi:tetratricopeptide (TPR) repeat protein